MVFPYETEAANGEPMPDGLSLVDQCAFYFLQTMYRGLRTGSKDRDQAIKEKGQMTYQYNKEKCIMESWRKMGDFWAETYRQVEAAQTADVAYFAPGWDKARGCKIENICAKEYGIHTIEA